MRKIMLLSLMFLFTLLNGQRVESELGINVGMNSTKNSGGSKFRNPTIGITYQDNKYIVMPRVDLEYVKVKNDYATSLLKGSVNAVYEYENPTYTIPYALAGVGYEYVGGATSKVFESHPFVQAGVGVRVDLEDGYKARLEGKMLQIVGSNSEGNEAIITAGISFPLTYAQARVKRPRVVRRPVKRLPQKKVKPKVFYVTNNECPLKINAPDLDRDGIENRFDQCPATPCNFTVDSYGCPVKTTLQVNFASNSATLKGFSVHKIAMFANFLLKNRGSFVQIIGHTDSIGSPMHNLVLSRKRANAIVQALVYRGVSPSRIRAEGRGETMPVAPNSSVGGRALNRRIEAILTYPKGRR